MAIRCQSWSTNLGDFKLISTGAWVEVSLRFLVVFKVFDLNFVVKDGHLWPCVRAFRENCVGNFKRMSQYLLSSQAFKMSGRLGYFRRSWPKRYACSVLRSRGSLVCGTWSILEEEISRAHDMGQVYVMDKVITLFNNRKLTAKKNLKKGENSLQKFKKN